MTPDTARAARQAADKANFHARRAAFDDEGYPQSFQQWSKLEADRRVARDMGSAVVL